MVDFDSTINDFGRQFLELLNGKYGKDFRYEDSLRWDFRDSFGPLGLTDEMEAFAWKTWDTPGFTKSLRPLPGSIDALHRLTDAGYHVIVVSSRPLKHAQWLRDWLDDKGLRQIDAWAQPMKLEFAQEYGVTMAFDDSPDHAVSLATHCPVYLIDHPWNQDVVGDNITRVESLWCAVEDLMQ